MERIKVLTRNTIIGDRIYPAGTPLTDIPPRGFLVDVMVNRPEVADDLEVDTDINLDPTAPPALPLERMKLAELQDLAKTRGLALSDDATRKQIIAALEAEG
jgi:hypothetical protein